MSRSRAWLCSAIALALRGFSQFCTVVTETLAITASDSCDTR